MSSTNPPISKNSDSDYTSSIQCTHIQNKNIFIGFKKHKMELPESHGTVIWKQIWSCSSRSSIAPTWTSSPLSLNFTSSSSKLGFTGVLPETSLSAWRAIFCAVSLQHSWEEKLDSTTEFAECKSGNFSQHGWRCTEFIKLKGDFTIRVVPIC